jgi:hypothetical protein
MMKDMGLFSILLRDPFTTLVGGVFGFVLQVPVAALLRIPYDRLMPFSPGSLIQRSLFLVLLLMLSGVFLHLSYDGFNQQHPWDIAFMLSATVVFPLSLVSAPVWRTLTWVKEDWSKD